MLARRLGRYARKARKVHLEGGWLRKAAATEGVATATLTVTAHAKGTSSALKGVSYRENTGRHESQRYIKSMTWPLGSSANCEVVPSLVAGVFTQADVCPTELAGLLRG